MSQKYYLAYTALIDECCDGEWDNWIRYADQQDSISEDFEVRLLSSFGGGSLSRYHESSHREYTEEGLKSVVKTALHKTFPKHAIRSLSPTPLIPFFRDMSSREKGEEVDEFWVLVEWTKGNSNVYNQVFWGFASDHIQSHRILSVRQTGVSAWSSNSMLLTELIKRMEEEKEFHFLSESVWKKEDFWKELTRNLKEYESEGWSEREGNYYRARTLPTSRTLYVVPLSAEDMVEIPSEGIINWEWL